MDGLAPEGGSLVYENSLLRRTTLRQSSSGFGIEMFACLQLPLARNLHLVVSVVVISNNAEILLLQSRSQFVHNFCDDFKTLIDQSSITTMCAPMKPPCLGWAPVAESFAPSFIGAHMVTIELWSIKVLKPSQK